jgi:penicillin-binding protein 2
MLSPGAYEDRVNLQTRLIVLRVGAVVAFGLLAVGFWLIQVLMNQRFEEMALNNHLRAIPLRAPRGVILDRTGKVLVDNRVSYTIVINRELTTSLPATLELLARITGTDLERLRQIVERHRREPMFRPIPVIEHATDAQRDAVLAREFEMPEVSVQVMPTRTYPDGSLAAHLFGYVSEINSTQLEQPEYAGLQQGALIGQAGIERAYNAKLMGRDGNRFVYVNSRGREMGDALEEQAPIDGQRLQLTIDLDLQRALEAAFRASGFNGAAVFMDPNTGEILAMTSRPAYDPNAFSGGMDSSTMTRWLTDPLRPFQNRLTQGRYSPGSTFKIPMAIAGLSEGTINPNHTEYCPGAWNFYGRLFRCHKEGGHGTVDLRRALEQSCNVYFYKLGDRLKIDTIHSYAEKLGLVGTTGIELPGENSSLVPSSEWKQKTFGEPWYPGETISVAIGQGYVSVTPLALGTMMATVANGGRRVTPHLVKAIHDGREWTPVTPPPDKGHINVSPEHMQAVRDGLWLAVNGAGTAIRGKIPGRDVAGKTGTAQVISRQGAQAAAGRTDKDLRDHGWFVFFAPRDNPQVAGVVFAEHAEHGYFGAPIARFVLETYFAKQAGEPLPPLPTDSLPQFWVPPGRAITANGVGGQ